MTYAKLTVGRTGTYAALTLGVLALAGCLGTEGDTSIAAGETASAATFAFNADRSDCWTNNVVTNGASFGLSTNSGYYCQEYNGPNPINNPFWIGFFSNGTISYQRRDGVHRLYTPFTTAANCDLGYDQDATHSTRYQILLNGQVDGSGYLTEATLHYFIVAAPGQMDIYQIRCQYKSIYGLAI